ncbi:uncharacterized protein [Physcomitrium patens]|uniref:uncharacterized protein isoform X2 n=1 Tax=Physcomitrium patens TaxID=3218 RepID=UPI000D175535|nr:pentatricopeptide repeat-containing protein At3g42630-like isoform X2 [Physcomitrium patens]|eukprot:XP_024370334.1 pentatricopeptide repeat-containing protein At3g42630-like isoform X2 [Physcomitrella patens]
MAAVENWVLLPMRFLFAEPLKFFVQFLPGNKGIVFCDACWNKSPDSQLADEVGLASTSSQSSSNSQLHEPIYRHSYELTAESSSIQVDDGSALQSRQDTNPMQNDACLKKSGKQRTLHVVDDLESGGSPLDILESMRECNPSSFWTVIDYLHGHRRMAEILEVFKWWQQQDGYKPYELYYTKIIRMLGQAHMPTEARTLFIEMCELGLRPSVVTYTYLLQGYAERGEFEEAEQILRDMILSGDAKPNTTTYAGLIYAYGKHGMYDRMWRTFNRMKTQHIPADEFSYRTLIKAYARGGLFSRMQQTMKEMSRNGMYADSATMNAVVLAYAEAGLVKEMEKQYEVMWKNSFTAGQETIKAIVRAYVKDSLFFQLSGYVKRVGLRKRTMVNYLWNALLLSHAANLAMDDLGVDFQNMKYLGFSPDVTTCNIMALAYSRAKQLEDLHQLIVTMQDNGIAPDLVTYGAVIDVFTEEKLRPNLLEELVEFRNLDVAAEVETDPLVFEVLGKGRFHVACEKLARNMEGERMNQRTYGELVGCFLQSLNKGRSSPPKVSSY